ncbi:MAG: homocysteine S-methyltransferase family protein [Kiritimatiellia bacterium]
MKLTDGLLFLDGGMGTLLQARGLVPGEAPEDWNLDRPADIAAIHRAYAAAGANVVYANTFGANRLKYHGKHTLEAAVTAGVAQAKAAVRARAMVALDVGPTGKLLKPAGDLDFEAAVDAFAETIRAGVAAGADLIAVETVSDVRELKAAVLAAKENCRLPVIATVSLGADGKLLTGGSVECVSALLESLEVDAYGFNCGLGPDQMLPFVERLAQISSRPVVAKPNAGLPTVVNGQTVFTVGPEEFAASVGRLVDAGATVIGGCCGTTPDHIAAVAARIAAHPTAPKAAGVRRAATVVSSGTDALALRPHDGLVIGERINPTGKKALKEAYARGDTALVLREAVRQVDAGARMLDVNCGVPGLDEAALLDATIASVQGVVTCPLQIDTANPEALARALRRVNGKALVNSVNGKRESMAAVFPLVRKYGGAMVALCLDENGIPPTSEGRLEIARRILAEGGKYGFTRADFVFDALTLAVSSDPDAARVTLETVRRLTDELGVNTVLGVSNVSFGLPNRTVLNNTMYALAKRAGLSAAIANPALIRDEVDPAAEDVLLGRDPACARWIAKNADAGVKPAGGGTAPTPTTGELTAEASLRAAIRRGLKLDARAAADAALADGRPPMAVVQEGIVPALEEVGCGFERGTVYLPQLLMAADAAGEAFAVVRRALAQAGGQTRPTGRPPVVIATVKGDIHDIGKNIVRALLENYGFDVIDLGRDVPPETIVETARKTQAGIVGLSALMTTTVGAMAETIRQLKASGLRCRTVVGGAVVTQDYADSIGADFYAKDAMRTVRIAESLLN